MARPDLAPLQARAGAIAARFLEHLDRSDPGTADRLRTLGGDGIEAWLVEALADAAASEEEPVRLIVRLARVGRAMAAAGVRPAQLASAGALLTRCVREELGAGFTPAIETAWNEVVALALAILGRAAAHAPGAGRA